MFFELPSRICKDVKNLYNQLNYIIQVLYDFSI